MRTASQLVRAPVRLAECGEGGEEKEDGCEREPAEAGDFIEQVALRPDCTMAGWAFGIQ